MHPLQQPLSLHKLHWSGFGMSSAENVSACFSAKVFRAVHKPWDVTNSRMPLCLCRMPSGSDAHPLPPLSASNASSNTSDHLLQDWRENISHNS